MSVHSGKLTKTLFPTLQSWPSEILPHTESENDALQIKRITDGFGGRERKREEKKKKKHNKCSHIKYVVSRVHPILGCLPPKTTCSSNIGAAKLNIYGR